MQLSRFISRSPIGSSSSAISMNIFSTDLSIVDSTRDINAATANAEATLFSEPFFFKIMFNLRSLGSHFDTSSLALPPLFPFLMGRNTSLEPTACVSCRSTKSSEAPVQRKSSQLATADTSNERNIPRNLLLPAPKSMWSLKRSTFVIITLCALELM